MSRDVHNYVKKCAERQFNKPKTKNSEELKITATPQAVFDKIVIDTIGSLPKSMNGNIYAVTMICDLSKYIINVPVLSKDARTTSLELVIIIQWFSIGKSAMINNRWFCS